MVLPGSHFLRRVLMVSLLLGSIFPFIAPVAHAQTRVNERDLEAMMRNLSADTKSFRPKFDADVRKKSIIRGTSQAKDAVKLMETFVKQTNELPNRFKKDRNGGDSFRVVQATALQVDATISSAQLNAQIGDKWQKIRSEVNQIAVAYNMPPPFGEGQGPSPNVAPVAMPLPASTSSQRVRISVFLNVPIAGADIAVYDVKGKRIFERKDATNDRGVYTAIVARLPKDFRVTAASDGSRLQDAALRTAGRFTLTADVRNYGSDFDIVYINPVTTLAADVADKVSGHDLTRAQNLVRHYLALPPNASLGAAMRQGPYYRSPYFSETVFLAQAAQHGGVDRFLNDLTPQALRPSSPSRRFSDGRKSPVLVAKFIGTNLAAGAISWLGGQGIGWALSSGQKPEPGATKKDIEQLQEKLADLQSSVDNLSSQLRTLSDDLMAELTTINYTQYVVPALTLSARVDGVEGNVAYYADECPPIPDDADGSSLQSKPKVDCPAELEWTMRQLNESEIHSSFEVFASYMQPNGAAGSMGMVRLYSRSLAAKVRFYRPADSTKMQQMFDYWYSVQIQSANLRVESLHLRNRQNTVSGRKELQDFLGDENAVPPKSGKLQSTLEAEQKLMYPAVPENTVINTRDKTMWLVAPLIIRNDPYEGPPRQRIECGPPPTGSIWNQVTGPVKIDGFDWQLPTKAQAAALLDGWTGSSANAWLTEKTRADDHDSPKSLGFPDYLVNRLVVCQFTYRRERAWTRELVGNGNHWYYTLDLQNGTVLNDRGGQTGISEFNYELLDREMKPGEQYYWY
jgi:hypothetical protein